MTQYAGKGERLAMAALVGLLALLAGVLDSGDPTPPWIRWPLVAAASVAMGWATWRLSREQ